MPKEKIHYIGFLANVDSSILKVNLGNGFKIEERSLTDTMEFLSTLDNVPHIAAGKSFFLDYSYCISNNKIYCINNSFDITVKNLGDLRNIFRSASEFIKFNKKDIDGYLIPVIRIMRLFKEGNIFMPLSRYFYYDGKTPKSLSMYWEGGYVEPRSKYKLENSELKGLQAFIKDTKYPFKVSSLQFAFENFELSYHTQNQNLSFLSLMMSLESLFNPPGAQGELGFRISRNTAILIGKDMTDSKSIWKKMKKNNGLYDKRCKIVHSGKSDIITEDELLMLRDYVRRSIKEFNKIGKHKEEILDMLNLSGFGEKLWRQNESEG